MARKKKSYEEQKEFIKRYAAKCDRVHITLNPDNPEDKAILEFLDSIGDPTHRGKTLKAIVKKYMAMTAALKGIQ